MRTQIRVDLDSTNYPQLRGGLASVILALSRVFTHYLPNIYLNYQLGSALFTALTTMITNTTKVPSPT